MTQSEIYVSVYVGIFFSPERFNVSFFIFPLKYFSFHFFNEYPFTQSDRVNEAEDSWSPFNASFLRENVLLRKEKKFYLCIHWKETKAFLWNEDKVGLIKIKHYYIRKLLVVTKGTLTHQHAFKMLIFEHFIWLMIKTSKLITFLDFAMRGEKCWISKQS